MNTYRKGEDFENKVFGIIKSIIDNEENFYLRPKYCKLFKKKEYYSKDRESNIIIDISIEIWMPNANNYSLLIPIECKNYDKAISINEVEEFYAKISQISGVNVKGVFVTTASFQAATLNYSRSKGIALIRILPEDQIDVILYKINVDSSSKNNFYQYLRDFDNAISNYDFKSNAAYGKVSDFYGVIENLKFDNWIAFLNSLILSDFNFELKDIVKKTYYKPHKFLPETYIESEKNNDSF